MEEEQKEVQPTIGEYQGKPILRIPTVDKPNPDTSWHWLSFGKNKAKAIVKSLMGQRSLRKSRTTLAYQQLHHLLQS